MSKLPVRSLDHTLHPHLSTIPNTLHHTPYNLRHTLHPTFCTPTCTLHPTLSTLPDTLHSTPYLHPTPYTLHPTISLSRTLTPNPELVTPNSEPVTPPPCTPATKPYTSPFQISALHMSVIKRKLIMTMMTPHHPADPRAPLLSDSAARLEPPPGHRRRVRARGTS